MRTTGVIDRIWRFFSSVKLTIVLLASLAAAMGYGTTIETAHSNGAARILVYHAWWFDALIGLLALNLIGCTLRRAPFKPHQAGWITTHIALLIIMAGAVVTHRFGMQGQMIIPEGEAEDTFHLEQLDRATLSMVTGEPRLLPFALRLVDFEQVMYPGSGTTRLFRSQVAVLDPTRSEPLGYDIVLNHPLAYGGFKFSQSSWIDLGEGMQATMLGVSYDPGIPLLYLGGGLLILGMAGIFFLKPYLKKKFPPQPAREPAEVARPPREVRAPVAADERSHREG